MKTSNTEEIELYNKNIAYLSEQVFEAAKLDIEVQKKDKRLCTDHIENLIHNYVTAGSPDPYTQDIMKEQLRKELVTNENAPYRKIKSALKDQANTGTIDRTRQDIIASMTLAVGTVALLTAVELSRSVAESTSRLPAMLKILGPGYFSILNEQIDSMRKLGVASVAIGASCVAMGAAGLVAPTKENINRNDLKQKVQEAIGNDFDGHPSNYQVNAAMEGYKKLLSRKDYTEDSEIKPKERKPQSQYPTRI